MNKVFGFLLALMLTATGAFAQGGAGFDLKAQEIVATDFGTWRATSRTTVAAGAATITLDNPWRPSVLGWGPIQPFYANNILLIDAENSAVDEEITVTSASCTSPTLCTITATFSNAHSGQYTIRSGTYGVNEAIKQVLGMGGGQVVVPADFPGVTADITGALGSTSVQVHDLRAGHDDVYGWSGAAYVAISSIGNTQQTFTAPLKLDGSNSLITAEGATADAFEQTLAIADPTADTTVTFADASGTVFLSSLSTNAPNVVNSVWGISNGLNFEGATADAFETTVAPTDPTADRTITLPDASITVNGTINYSCGTTSTCTPVNDSSTQRSFSGSAALVSGTPSTVVVSGFSPAFTSTSTYTCVAIPEGTTAAIAAAGVAVSLTSSSSVTFTGPNTVTTVIDYVCRGK